MTDSFLIWRDHVFGQREETLAEAIREFARERGISERTAWRWYSRAERTRDFSLLRPRRCAECGKPLPAGARANRQYCREHQTSRAKVRRHRRRRQSVLRLTLG